MNRFCQCCGIYSINDLESRLDVIRGRWFWHQSKAPRDFQLVLNTIVTLVFPCHLSQILKLLYAKSHFFHTPAYSGQRFVHLKVIVLFGSAESEHPGLTSHEIIFEDFQPVSTIPQCHVQTTCRSNTALCIASRSKNFCFCISFFGRLDRTSLLCENTAN